MFSRLSGLNILVKCASAAFTKTGMLICCLNLFFLNSILPELQLQTNQCFYKFKVRLLHVSKLLYHTLLCSQNVESEKSGKSSCKLSPFTPIRGQKKLSILGMCFECYEKVLLKRLY